MADETDNFVESIKRVQSLLGLGRTYVKTQPNVDSKLAPGTKVVMSDPVVMMNEEKEKEPVPYERFCEELWAFCREPLFPYEEIVLKKLEYEEIDEDSFFVKVIHDGAKWKRLGQGDGSDFVRQWAKMTWDKKERTISSEDYDVDPDAPGGKKIKGRCVTRFSNESPFFIEFFMENSLTGVRMTGEFPSIFLSSFYINPIISVLQRRACVVDADADSPSMPGSKSVLSSTLDGIVSTEEVFDGLIDAVNEQHKNWKQQKVDENQWEFTMVNADRDAPPQKYMLVTERDTLEFFCVTQTGNELNHTEFVKILNNPMRVENWIESSDGKTRLHGKTLARNLQNRLNDIVQKAEGGWFW